MAIRDLVHYNNVNSVLILVTWSCMNVELHERGGAWTWRCHIIRCDQPSSSRLSLLVHRHGIMDHAELPRIFRPVWQVGLVRFETHSWSQAIFMPEYATSAKRWLTCTYNTQPCLVWHALGVMRVAAYTRLSLLQWPAPFSRATSSIGHIEQTCLSWGWWRLGTTAWTSWQRCPRSLVAHEKCLHSVHGNCCTRLWSLCTRLSQMAIATGLRIYVGCLDDTLHYPLATFHSAHHCNFSIWRVSAFALQKSMSVLEHLNTYSNIHAFIQRSATIPSHWKNVHISCSNSVTTIQVLSINTFLQKQ